MDRSLFALWTISWVFVPYLQHQMAYGLKLQTPIFEKNTFVLKWNDSSPGGYILQIIKDDKSLPFIHLKYAFYKIENALLHKRYDVTVIGNSSSRPRDKVTFHSPTLLKVSVGSNSTLQWELSGENRLLGYRVLNIDTNEIYLDFNGMNFTVIHPSFHFNGNPKSLRTLTSIMVKSVDLRFGGYIVSELSSSQVYGGIVLAVTGKPTTPVIRITKELIDVRENITENETHSTVVITCSAKPNCSPDYIDFPAIRYEWYSNKSKQLPVNLITNGSSLRVKPVRALDTYLRISCRAYQDDVFSDFSEEINLHVIYPSEPAVTPHWHQNTWFYTAGALLFIIALENLVIGVLKLLRRKRSVVGSTKVKGNVQGKVDPKDQGTVIFRQDPIGSREHVKSAMNILYDQDEGSRDPNEQFDYMNIPFGTSGNEQSRVQNVNEDAGKEEAIRSEWYSREDQGENILQYDTKGKRWRSVSVEKMEALNAYDELECTKDDLESKYRSLRVETEPGNVDINEKNTKGRKGRSKKIKRSMSERQVRRK